MSGVVVTFTVPSDVLSALRLTSESAPAAIKLAAAMHWFSRGVISEEMAAHFVGLTRSQFLRELAKAEVPVCDVDIDEVRAAAGLSDRKLK